MTWVGFHKAELETVETRQGRSQPEAAPAGPAGVLDHELTPSLRGGTSVPPTSEVPQLCHPQGHRVPLAFLEDKFMFL